MRRRGRTGGQKAIVALRDEEGRVLNCTDDGGQALPLGNGTYGNMIFCVRMEVDDTNVSDLDLGFYLCIGLELRLDERKRDEAMLID